MEVGIIGPKRIVQKIHGTILQNFPDFTPHAYVYKDYTQAPSIVKYNQKYLDALIFAGGVPYRLSSETIKPMVPWGSVPLSSGALLRALLFSSLKTGCNIKNVSIDGYQEGTLFETYAEIGIEKEQLNVFLAETRVCKETSEHLEYIRSFHERLYTKGKVAFCLTGIESVYDSLEHKKIPCLLIEPTVNSIRESINKLLLNYQLKVSQQSQIVVLSIQIDTPRDHSLFNENTYQFLIDKMKVSKQIYLFAQKLQAAVVEPGAKNYLLFSTRQLLESETNNLDNMSLLSIVKDSSHSSISLGIGFGKTVQEAEFSANLGMQKSLQRGGDMAFIVHDGKTVIGPVKHASFPQNDVVMKLDKRFSSLSEQTGISINTIFRLHGIIEQYAKTDFTSAELAEHLGVTLRTVNKMVEKLEAKGKAYIIGKKMFGEAGRPRRIIQLFLQ